MNSIQLRWALTKDPVTQVQLGHVCALDELPRTVTQRPKLYIVNTADCRRPGKHWLALYFPRVGPAECFDSLGHGPKFYHWRLHRYLMTQGGSYVTNTRRYQQAGTKTCGQFCLYYSFQRCTGRPMQQILEDFDGHTLDSNEELVTYFVKERDVMHSLDQLHLD